MGISEEKIKIVIENYFNSECNVNTSIREAFEKGFRIGMKKGIQLKKEPPKEGEAESDNQSWYSDKIHTDDYW